MIWLLLEYRLVLTDFLNRNGNDALLGRLARLEELGNLLRAPASELLDDGIFELRANSKEGQLRVYYFFGPGCSADHYRSCCREETPKGRSK